MGIKNRNLGFLAERPRRLIIILILALLPGACAEFRGLPTHGGGKRFDEEERIVAGSIRRALADMDLRGLRGRNIAIQMDSLAHSGGGAVAFPGIQGFNANANAGQSAGQTLYPFLPTPGTYLPFSDNRSENNNSGYSGGISGSFITNYTPTTLGSDPDLSYLKSALTMKAQHCGVNVVTANPEILLYVLVDVLGTNRSRDDSFFFWTDKLLASCELTYYAQDVKTGQLVFRARHTSATGAYLEKSFVGFSAYEIDLKIESTPGTALPVDGDEAAPLAARAGGDKKAPKNALIRRLGLSELGDWWAQTWERPADKKLEQTMKQFLTTQLANARMQLQANNPGQAQHFVDLVRAVQPDYPGLLEIQAELTRRQQQPNPPALK